MPAPSSFSAMLAEEKPIALQRLELALKRNNGNKSAAARDLGLKSYKTLWQLGERHPHVREILDRHGLPQAAAAALATRARRKAAKKRRAAKST